MTRTLARSSLSIVFISVLGASAHAESSADAGTAAPRPETAHAAARTAAANAPELDNWRDLDEARLYLNRAQLEIGRRDYKAAATSLRQAAAAIDQDAARTHGQSSLALQRDASALRATAAAAEAGKVQDPSSLTRRFTDIREHLARYHYAAAGEAWSKTEYSLAGHSLAAAARYVESSLAALGQESSIELKSAEAAAMRLTRKGAAAIDSEYEHASGAVARELERLHKAGKRQNSSWPAKSPLDAGA